MISLQYSPIFLLLFIPLLLRLAPCNIWGSILAQVIPATWVPRFRFCFSERFIHALSTCTPFWCLSFIRGFEVLAHLNSDLFRAMTGQDIANLFQSILPSFSLRATCQEGENMFGCIEFSGWIDKSQMMRVIQRVYPNYFYGHFNNTVDFDTFWKEVILAQNDAKLQIFIGNQNFVDPVEADKKTLLMMDLSVNLVFCEFFIFHLPITWREKLRMNFIMLLQTLPLLIDLVLYESYVSILVFYIALSHILIYVTYTTSSFIHNRCPRIYKPGHVFLMNFILILIPILVFQMISIINHSYNNSLKKLEEHCFGKTKSVEYYSHSIGEYTDDDMQLAKLKSIFPAEYIDAYKDLYRIMNSFGRINFRQAFFNIYGYMLVVLSCVPLITEIFYCLLKGSHYKKERMLLAVLLCIGLVLGLCFFVPKSYILNGISWDSANIMKGVFGDALAASMEVYRSSKKSASDLNSLTRSRIDWIQKELLDRLPPFLRSYEGVVTCRTLRYNVLEVFHNFRKQLITLYQFKLTISYYFSAFTPLFIFLYIFIFF